MVPDPVVSRTRHGYPCKPRNGHDSHPHIGGMRVESFIDLPSVYVDDGREKRRRNKRPSLLRIWPFGLLC